MLTLLLRRLLAAEPERARLAGVAERLLAAFGGSASATLHTFAGHIKKRV
jgi:hypothetical protein